MFSIALFWLGLLTLSQMTNFRIFQTERVCRRQCKLDVIGTKFSKWVENTVGKGEIARYASTIVEVMVRINSDPHTQVHTPNCHCDNNVSDSRPYKPARQKCQHYQHFLPFFFLKTVNPLPDDKILDWSKLKQIADDILKCI